MRRFSRLAIAALAVFLLTGTVAADEPKHLSIGWGSSDGQLLVQELNCAACHAGETDLLPKQAPRLSDAGSRITPQYLRAFLADPQQVKPGPCRMCCTACPTASGRKRPRR